MMRMRIDGVALAGVILMGFFLYNVAQGWFGPGNDGDGPLAPVEQGAVATIDPEIVAAAPVEPPAESGTGGPSDPAWHTAVAVPYDTYFLTQGIHGQSYGHYAIDIAGGNGAIIYAMINGTVTGMGYDQWGNTFIQIENNNYIVLYLHGIYTPTIGQIVSAGEAIGSESNIGYTLDMYGNLCAGRDCGYHTHLNVFDKRLGTNIDPLSLIPANYP